MVHYFKNIILILCLTISLEGMTQIVLTSETFGAGAAKGTVANGFVGDMGTWTTANTGANGGSANDWYVSGEECGNAAGTCGSACPGGDNSLHISAIGGLCGTPDCGAAYDETSVLNQTNKRAISPTVNCLNQYFIELNFNYIAAQGDDGFFVEFSLDNGATWTTFTGGNLVESGCCCLLAGFCTNLFDPTPCSDLFSAQGYWTAVNLSFPIGADNNSTVKFAFHWSNDGNGIGTDPSVAIDDITVTYATTLPIELTDLRATKKNLGNSISWTTLSEANASHFVIEYSEDGTNFRNQGNVDAFGNSANSLDYSFFHETYSSNNYYRIRTVDMDGQYAYSEIVYVKNELGFIRLQQELNYFTVFGIEETNGSVNVYDLSGNIITETISFGNGQSEVRFNLENLSRGIYIIEVATPKGNKQFKILR
jgi:Secretion system C-terminal sorting domain